MRPIVFLDFDDVLAFHETHNSYRVLDAFAHETSDASPELWLKVFDADAKQNLGTLHEEFKPNYVISSSWASHLDREQMAMCLQLTKMQFVHQNLCEHWCTPRDAPVGRLSEIEAWLERYATTKGFAYVILDDHASGGALCGSWLENKTVFCDAWVGFNDEKLKAAREILLSQCR
jgi:hypothetical protein